MFPGSTSRTSGSLLHHAMPVTGARVGEDSPIAAPGRALEIVRSFHVVRKPDRRGWEVRDNRSGRAEQEHLCLSVASSASSINKAGMEAGTTGTGWSDKYTVNIEEGRGRGGGRETAY